MKRTHVDLRKLKLQRLFQEWTLEIKRRKCKRKLLQRKKRNIILAISLVLERESLEMQDFLYRKRLYRSLYAMKLVKRIKAINQDRK